MTEDSAAGSDWVSELCEKWEESANVDDPQVRQAVIRIGDSTLLYRLIICTENMLAILPIIFKLTEENISEFEFLNFDCRSKIWKISKTLFPKLDSNF